jgi:hypothetical protein
VLLELWKQGLGPAFDFIYTFRRRFAFVADFLFNAAGE